LGVGLGTGFGAAFGVGAGAVLGAGAGVGRVTGSGSGGTGTGSGGAAMSSSISSPSRAAGGVSLITGAVDCGAVSAIRSTSIGGLSKRRSPAVHCTDSRPITRTCSTTAIATPVFSCPNGAVRAAMTEAYCTASEPSVTAAVCGAAVSEPVVTSAMRDRPARFSSPITRITRP